LLKQGATLTLTPQTLNYLGNSNVFETSGYTATISDIRTLATFTGVGVNTPAVVALNSTTTIGTNVSKTVIGTSFQLRGTTVNTLFGSQTSIQATLTIIGNDSGARLVIPVTITKA